MSKTLTPKIHKNSIKLQVTLTCDSGCKFISGSSITKKSPLLARNLKYKSNGASCLIEEEALYRSISKPFFTETLISFPPSLVLLN